MTAAVGCLGGHPQPAYPEAECGDAGLVWLAMLVCNVCNDVSGIAISKHGSAALGEMWSSLTLCVTIGLMRWPWLTGKTPRAVTGYTLGSLVLILCGLGLYGWYPERRQQGEMVVGTAEVEEVSEGGAIGVPIGGDGTEDKQEDLREVLLSPTTN